jgi:exosortase/archaeosortase family protein
MLTFVGVESFGHYANEITLQNHFTVLVVWGCTAIKQSFIFLCIMLITPGPEKHKFWYIPLGLILIYFINVFRIFAITLICKDYPQYFYFLHYYLFKYIFYVLIFFIWIFWEEKINMKKGT